MKTFVDNVSIQAVEALVLAHLPELFSPTSVAQTQETLIEKIASESQESQEIRASLTRKMGILENGMETCKRYMGRPITSQLFSLVNEIRKDLLTKLLHLQLLESRQSKAQKFMLSKQP